MALTMIRSISRSSSNRVAIATVLAIAGIVLAWTPLFAPIHEMAHTASAQRHGISVDRWSWRTTYLNAPANEDVIVAGYMGELIFWTFASIVPYVGPFAAGYVLSRYVYAFGSYDFARLPPSYVDRFAMYGAFCIAISVALAWLFTIRPGMKKARQ